MAGRLTLDQHIWVRILAREPTACGVIGSTNGRGPFSPGSNPGSLTS